MTNSCAYALGISPTLILLQKIHCRTSSNDWLRRKLWWICRSPVYPLNKGSLKRSFGDADIASSVDLVYSRKSLHRQSDLIINEPQLALWVYMWYSFLQLWIFLPLSRMPQKIPRTSPGKTVIPPRDEYNSWNHEEKVGLTFRKWTG